MVFYVLSLQTIHPDLETNKKEKKKKRGGEKKKRTQTVGS